jgi:hypothetical protein
VRFRHAGRTLVRVTRAGYRPATASLLVRPRRAAAPGFAG